MKKIFATLVIVGLGQSALCATENFNQTLEAPNFPDAPATMKMEQPEIMPPHPDMKGGVSISYMTTRTTQDVSKQNMRSSMGGGGGDSGGGPGAALPNLNYVSLSGFLPFARKHSLMAMAMKSLESGDQLKQSTPGPADLELPSQIYMLGYRYELSPALSFDVHTGYIDSEKMGFQDPSLGVNYVRINPFGWTPMVGVSASVPTSKMSNEQNIATRASLRFGALRRFARSSLNATLFHMHSFYDGDGKQKPMPGDQAQQTSDGPPPVAGAPTAKPSVPIFPSDVDLILLEREVHKSRFDLSYMYDLTDNLQVGMGTGISYTHTEKAHDIWMTSAKPAIVNYTYKQAEAGVDVSLNSDIQDYNQPRPPSILTVGLRVGYTFGDKLPLN